MNAASVIGISFGTLIGNLVGADQWRSDGVNYLGVIVAPLPVLLAEGNYLRELQQVSSADSEIFAMPFSAWHSHAKHTRKMVNASPARRANILSWWQWVRLGRRRRSTS
ncbi:hypothetical protein M2387_004624 [Klebsiella sp. BIGb0407]|nr:hypothetical protein [Klebsiella sp. BIGb0407]